VFRAPWSNDSTGTHPAWSSKRRPRVEQLQKRESTARDERGFADVILVVMVSKLAAVVAAVGLVLLATGCSSTGRSLRASPVDVGHPPGWVPPPPAPPAALALAQRLLDDAVLPPGVKPYRGPLPRWLNADPAGTPELVNLVQAHRFWTMRSTAPNVAGFLQRYRRHGFTASGVGSAGTLRSKTDRALFTDNHLTVLPANISNAQLDLSVADAGSGNVVIRVDAIVAWTKPRPRAEFASAQDRVVILTVVHVDGPKPRPGKRVVATKADLVQPIVESFNQLRVSAPAYSYECPPGGRLSYQVAFVRSPDTPPDLVASIGPCFGVGAMAGKRALPGLDPSGAFSDSVAHLLGSSQLH